MRAFLMTGGFALLAWAAVAQAVPPADLVDPTDLAPYRATNTNDIVAQVARKMTACQHMHESKVWLKTKTAVAHCMYDGYAETLRAVGAPNIDLTDELISGEFAVADRYDRHKITDLEARAEANALESHIQTELLVRINSAQQMAAAEQVARSAQDRQVAQQQLDRQITAQAQADQERRMRLCAAAGMLQTAGSIGESLGNAYRARAYCEAGLPPPTQPQVIYQPAPPPLPTTTNCYRSGPNLTCTQQ